MFSSKLLAWVLAVVVGVIAELECSVLSETASSVTCNLLKPGHEFNLQNTSLLKCYISLSKTGTGCDPEQKDLTVYPRCVENSKCIRRLSYSGISSGRCMCDANFKMTSFFTCDPIRGKGESCRSWKLDTVPKREQEAGDCERSDGLLCLNGTCQCRNPGRGGTCLLKSDGPCRLGQSGPNATAECPPNSHCSKYEMSSDYKWGSCRCNKGFTSRGGVCESLPHFDEACDPSVGLKCNEFLGLTCVNGVCKCDLPKSDPSQTWCTIRLDRECGGSAHDGQKGRCPANATCTDGRCKCKEGFLSDTSDSTCKLLRFLGDTCDDTNRCDYNSGLKCTKGKCECNSRKSADNKSCIIGAGDWCTISNATSHCTENAICEGRPFLNPNSGYCSCSRGFVRNWRDGKCVQMLSKGATCTPGSFPDKNLCDSYLGLGCVNSKCACAKGESSDGKCKLQIHGYCYDHSSSPPCPANARCEVYIGHKWCMCLPNFIKTDDGMACVPGRQHGNFLLARK